MHVSIRKILLLFLITVPFCLPQSKYFIYFKDKGIQKTEALNKTSNQYIEIMNSLSERAIERRKKVLGENFINYSDLPVNKDYILQLDLLGIEIVHELKWFNSVSAYLTNEQLSLIKELPFIEKVEPVKKLKFIRDEKTETGNILKSNASVTTIDYGPSITQLLLSDIPAVHSRGITGEGIIIGLLDSGFDWQTHESLRDAEVIAEYDFIFNDDKTSNETEDVSNQHDHGTNVFSVVGGYKEGSLIGAAFGAGFLLAKTERLGSETHAEEDNYAAALIWMEERGVDITSSSLGYSDFDAGEGDYTYQDMNGNTTIVTKAAEEAFRRGIVVITSAGNEGNNSWRYITAPADGFNVIAVGAVTSQNQLAAYSSRGPTFDGRIKPDILAQGSGVYAAVAGSESWYTRVSGTSDAAPIASGVAALLLSHYPHLTNQQVRSILQKTSDNYAAPNNDLGYGLVSAVKAISYPNFHRSGSLLKLHKAFLEKSDINPTAVLFHYKQNEEDFSNTPLSFDGNHTYTYDIPFLQSEDSIFFYFTYSDSSGNNFREPSTGLYTSKYGDFDITIIGEENKVIPEGYILSRNYPNPFPSPSNPFTSISYKIPEASLVKLSIYNILGEEVAVLVNSIQSAGPHTVTWNGSNFASGVYIFRLSAGEFISSGKMILSK
ncbi:MAG: S8 family serine peptidase [Ignavibacteriaceae bacterium]